jgi:hypothetical protein
MSLSWTPSPPHFRLPTDLTTSSKTTPIPAFQAPLQDLFEGDWYVIRSSINFWKDKRNVRFRYTPASSYMENQASYQTMTSDTIKSMSWRDTPSETETGIFTWRREALLRTRVASAKWEVLCFTSRPSKGDWMLIYVHKSMFVSPGLNLLCRNKEGPSSADMSCIEQWLRGVSDDRFQQTVDAMVDVTQQ